MTEEESTFTFKVKAYLTYSKSFTNFVIKIYLINLLIQEKQNLKDITKRIVKILNKKSNIINKNLQRPTAMTNKKKMPPKHETKTIKHLFINLRDINKST